MADVDLRAAYAMARGLFLQAGPVTTPGHRLFWSRGAMFGSLVLSAAPEAYAIVGRHTQCSVMLPDDPFVALRHLLVRSVPLEAGGLALRILDLHTDAAFGLVDRSLQTSIFAEGVVAVAVGEYALIAIPTDAREADLPPALPSPVLETPKDPREQIAIVSRGGGPYRENARPRATRITLMPSVMMFGEPLAPSLGRLTRGGTYRVTLARDVRSASVVLASEDLARGVILGRSEKCHSEELRRITDAGTSRTHVLLLGEGPNVSAYDIASTHGTYANGWPVHRMLLADGGARFVLGTGPGAVQVYWSRA